LSTCNQHKILVEGRSARVVARQMGLSRNTVRRYLDQGTPIGVRAGDATIGAGAGGGGAATGGAAGEDGKGARGPSSG
jgi:hypothetical protein